MSDKDNEPVYTEAQHLALLTDGVRRETATLREASESAEAQKAELLTQNADLQSQIDVLTAEKASAEARTAEVQGEFDKFKADLDDLRVVAERTAERVEQIKAAAPHLSEDYVSDPERQARWAQMADDDFGALIESLQTASVGMKPDGEGGEGAGSGAGGDAATTKAQARETAAFKGGTEPKGKSGESSLGTLLTRTRKLPEGLLAGQKS